MLNRIIYDECKNNICYFRTGVENGYSKVLVQITDRCNMYCKHCFVRATSTGCDLNIDDFKNYYINFFKRFKTKKVTLTGGEPLLNKNILDICTMLDSLNITVTICTNGYNNDKNLIDNLLVLKNVLFNVSLDGFSTNTIQKFRGCSDAYDIVKNNITKIASNGKLKGILCTPNVYGTVDEYVQLVEFAKKVKAKYVLFNPIGAFGRGNQNVNKCSVDNEFLSKLILKTEGLITDDFKISYIRFPNVHNYQNSSCNYKGIYYIYVNGDVVGCPYISFAYNTISGSIGDSLLGNVLKDKLSDFKTIEDSGEVNNTCIAHEILDNGIGEYADN